MAQLLLVLRGAAGLLVEHERPRPPVVVLGGLGRGAGVDAAAVQQGVQVRGALRIDGHAQCAGEMTGAGREAQIGIARGLLPARAAAQRQRLAVDRQVQRLPRRTLGWWRRQQLQAGRDRGRRQIAARLARRRCGRRRCRCGRGVGRRRAARDERGRQQEQRGTTETQGGERGHLVSGRRRRGGQYMAGAAARQERRRSGVRSHEGVAWSAASFRGQPHQLERPWVARGDPSRQV